MVKTKHHAIGLIDEGVITFNLIVCDGMSPSPIQIEGDCVPVLFHTIGMELGLRSTIAPELSHVLLSLLRIPDPRCMNIRL